MKRLNMWIRQGFWYLSACSSRNRRRDQSHYFRNSDEEYMRLQTSMWFEKPFQQRYAGTGFIKNEHFPAFDNFHKYWLEGTQSFSYCSYVSPYSQWSGLFGLPVDHAWSELGHHDHVAWWPLCCMALVSLSGMCSQASWSVWLVFRLAYSICLDG